MVARGQFLVADSRLSVWLTSRCWPKSTRVNQTVNQDTAQLELRVNKGPAISPSIKDDFVVMNKTHSLHHSFSHSLTYLRTHLFTDLDYLAIYVLFYRFVYLTPSLPQTIIFRTGKCAQRPADGLFTWSVTSLFQYCAF